MADQCPVQEAFLVAPRLGPARDIALSQQTIIKNTAKENRRASKFSFQTAQDWEKRLPHALPQHVLVV